MTARAESGHRAVPHTADVRIEAWAPARERCIAEAVRGLVDGFAEITQRPTSMHECEVFAEADEDLLVAVLDEVIYRLDTEGQLPVDADVSATEDGALVRFAMVDVGSVRSVGAVPKAVSLHELDFSGGDEGWSCSVTIDV